MVFELLERPARSWQNTAFQPQVQPADPSLAIQRIVSISATRAALVLTTIAADADGAALARTLVEERLAACVNVLPAMTSVYRWKGQVEQDREQQMVIKTTIDRLPALEARVRELHAYELPEFLVIAADDGAAAYLAWLDDSVRR